MAFSRTARRMTARAFLIALTFGAVQGPVQAQSQNTDLTARNEAIVRQAFDNWGRGAMSSPNFWLRM